MRNPSSVCLSVICVFSRVQTALSTVSECLTGFTLLISFSFLFCSLFFLQTWLFGYELSDTLVVFSPDFMTIIASKKKLAFLQPLEGLTEVKVKLVLRSKVSPSSP